MAKRDGSLKPQPSLDSPDRNKNEQTLRARLCLTGLFARVLRPQHTVAENAIPSHSSSHGPCLAEEELLVVLTLPHIYEVVI